MWESFEKWRPAPHACGIHATYPYILLVIGCSRFYTWSSALSLSCMRWTRRRLFYSSDDPFTINLQGLLHRPPSPPLLSRAPYVRLLSRRCQYCHPCPSVQLCKSAAHIPDRPFESRSPLCCAISAAPALMGKENFLSPLSSNGGGKL